MSVDVSRDQLAVIRIEGMHCHKCERAIQASLQRQPGVHEVEVDFNSRQASVLYDPAQAGVAQLMQAVTDAGYRAAGFTQGQVGQAV